MTPTALADGPTLTEHQRTPSTVEKRRAAGTSTREETYRQQEQLLHQYADQKFWTDTYVNDARERGIPGYQGGAGNTAAQLMLDFAGFRVIDSRRNRNGYAYMWARDPLMPWPTEFAAVVTGAALAKQRAAELRRAGGSMVEPEPEPITADDVEVVPEEETSPATPEEDELDLAVEQEQRAIKAERERDGLKVSLDKEKREHAETRRSLMVRIARMELAVTGKDQEITRLRSLVEERTAQLREQGEQDAGTLLVGAEANLNSKIRELQQKLADEEDRANELQRRAAAARTAAQQGDDGWWPLEGGDQTVTQLIEGATQFGLDVRIQARRKDS